MPDSHPFFPYDASVASKYDSLRGWRPPIPERILAVAAGIARLRAYAASPQARDERQTPFTLVFARKV